LAKNGLDYFEVGVVKTLAHIMLLLQSLLAFDNHCMCFPTSDPPAYPGSSHPTVALPVEELRR
jgi:hypothetical protein